MFTNKCYTSRIAINNFKYKKQTFSKNTSVMNYDPNLVVLSKHKKYESYLFTMWILYVLLITFKIL